MQDKDFFRKNYKLNSEFHIVGSFIYNGLRVFNQMRVFTEEDVFSFLYNISVGIERLEKILIIISNKDVEEDNLLQKIKNHDHLKLLSIIEENHSFKFELKHKKFLYLLSDFYKRIRYDKLNSSGYVYESKDAFLYYIRSIDINVQTFLDNKLNSDNIRKNIGKIIGKIVNDLYNKINKENQCKNIHTTETYSLTKAYKIFLEKSYDFLNERKLMKEIIIFLINNKKKNDYFSFIKDNIKPLNFDPALVEEYIKFPDSDLDKKELMEEMNHLYEEMSKEERKERLNTLSLIERICCSSEENIDW